jgi:hypothetical protein
VHIWRICAIFPGWHGSCSTNGTGIHPFGRQTMTAKFEALAFTIGFLATGFLTLVALPLA